MAKLFSDEWMKSFAKLWNADRDMVENLSEAGFSSSIGFGCVGDKKPVGIVEVKEGRVVYAGEFQGQALDWDLRAEVDAWKEWLTEGFGFDKLGVSISTGKLSFVAGDYRQMIRYPNMAKPFLRHFELMGKLKTEFTR
ncbi:SCP-2 sterol transfer family protein [Sulfuriflexus mobilis]|uniref:SCP-2 sterol transfer family protein n=1 Tax=Sulfuriflexus mobilis TaxID=1811807 RepID=UPI000F841FEE|nr:SCP-2 sterol transfer family protein [Sulfuriflexus mobilis]